MLELGDVESEQTLASQSGRELGSLRGSGEVQAVPRVSTPQVTLSLFDLVIAVPVGLSLGDHSHSLRPRVVSDPTG